MRQAAHAVGLILPDCVTLRGRDEDDRIVRRAQAIGEALHRPDAGAFEVLGRNPEVLALHADVQPHRVLARLDLRIGNLPLRTGRSEEHTTELQSQMRISYAAFCLKKKKKNKKNTNNN